MKLETKCTHTYQQTFNKKFSKGNLTVKNCNDAPQLPIMIVMAE